MQLWGTIFFFNCWLFLEIAVHHQKHRPLADTKLSQVVLVVVKNMWIISVQFTLICVHSHRLLADTHNIFKFNFYEYNKNKYSQRAHHWAARLQRLPRLLLREFLSERIRWESDAHSWTQYKFRARQRVYVIIRRDARSSLSMYALYTEQACTISNQQSAISNQQSIISSMKSEKR